MTKKAKKMLDAEIEKLYHKLGAGRSINIMDIGKVFDAGYAAVTAGKPLEPAIAEAVAKYTAVA